MIVPALLVEKRDTQRVLANTRLRLPAHKHQDTPQPRAVKNVRLPAKPA
jgi:hypothetical protein